MSYAGAANAHEDGFFTQSLVEAFKDEFFVQEVIRLYQKTFNAKGWGEWGEQWQADDVRKKLFEDADGQHDRSFITTWRAAGQLVGFAIIVIGSADQCVRLADLPPGCQDQATKERVLAAIRSPFIRSFTEGKPIVFFREIGILSEARGGFIPVGRLIADSLVESMKFGAHYGLFWSSVRKRLIPIALALGMEIFHDFGDRGDNILAGGSVAETWWLIQQLSDQPKEKVAQWFQDRLQARGRAARQVSRVNRRLKLLAIVLILIKTWRRILKSLKRT